MNVAMLTLIALLGAHWFFDYAGQGDFMAKAKNPVLPLVGVPWRPVLIAHAGIHAAAVALITGLSLLFVCEYVAHYAIDRLKCDGHITFETDQHLHLVCKVVWWAVWLAVA